MSCSLTFYYFCSIKHKKMRFYYLLFCILLAVGVSGQTRSVVSLTTDDGMSNGSALCVHKDQRGYVYIGTDIGVDRFDGKRFVKIPFAGEVDSEKSDISCIIEESAEALLVGSQMGLWRLDTRRLVMERVFPKEINFEVTSAVKAADGTIYVGTVNGLYAVKDNRVKALDLYKNTKQRGRWVKDVTYSRSGRQGYIWAAMRKGLICMDVASGRVIQYAWLYDVNDNSRELTKIAVTRNGRVFVGTEHDGVIEFLPATKSFQNYYFKGRQIADMNYTEDNHLLVATGFHGAFDIDLSNNQISRSYSTHEIGGGVKTRFDSPCTFYRDPMGVDWIGYRFFGIDHTYYNRGTFHVYQIPGLFDSGSVNVRSFLRDDNKTLLGTRNGLVVVDEEKHEVRIVGEEILDAMLVSRIVRIGSLYWIGTINGGLHLLDVNSLVDLTPESLKQQLAGSNIYDMTTDERNHVWVCSSAGLLRYDELSGNSHLYTSSNSQLPDNEVLSMAFDSSGKGWISTYRGGISLYYEEMDAILSKKNMPAKAADLGAAVSIEKQANNKMLFLQLHDYPVMYNIGEDFCQAVHPDISANNPRSQYYHLLPDHSFVYSTKDALYLGRRDGIRKFCYIDGLPSHQFQTHAYNLDDKGIFWAATNGGLVYASIQDMQKSEFPHIPIIVSDIVSDHNYSDVEINMVNHDAQIKLSRYKNSLVLSFSPLVYGDVRDIVYRYKLEGYEDEWHRADNDHSVYYPSIFPGDYNLKIEAVGIPEINTSIAVSVPMTYAAMVRMALILLLMSIVGHIIYCKVKKKDYIWERLMPKPEKYQTSRMDKREAAQLIKSLKTYMEDKKPYKSPDLTMGDLAKAIGCSSHTLSQVFSQHLNRNYYDYIAEYRVNEFKRLAADPKNASLTITALSEKCGFASRNPFLTAFKKFTGMTPKDYMKTIKK